MEELQKLENMPLKGVREKVISTLQYGYAHDFIEEREFEERLHEATNSDNRTALLALVKDLPGPREEKQKNSVNRPLAEEGEYYLNEGQVKEDSAIITIMSGSERKGVWKPPKRLKVFTVMGGADLDFTKAALNPGTTTISIFCLMGGVDIFVPKGVNVEVHGLPIMGGLDNKTEEFYDENAPTIKIKAFVLMGGVDIKHKKKKGRKEE